MGQSPDELEAHFTLDEEDSEACRRQFEKEQPDKVREFREAERNAGSEMPANRPNKKPRSLTTWSWKKRTSTLEIPWGILCLSKPNFRLGPVDIQLSESFAGHFSSPGAKISAE